MMHAVPSSRAERGEAEGPFIGPLERGPSTALGMTK